MNKRKFKRRLAKIEYKTRNKLRLRAASLRHDLGDEDVMLDLTPSCDDEQATWGKKTFDIWSIWRSSEKTLKEYAWPATIDETYVPPIWFSGDIIP